MDVNHQIDEPLYFRRIHGSNISLEHRENEKERQKIILAMAMRMAQAVRKRNGRTQSVVPDKGTKSV